MRASALPFASLLLLIPMAPVSAATTPPANVANALGQPSDGDAHIIKITTGQGQPVNRHLTLGVNKSAIIELDTDAKDVLVSSPAVANAIIKTPRRIFLVGSKTGQTNAFIFDDHGHQVLSLDIRVENDVADLTAMIRANLPNSAIKVAALNDNVVLTGRVASTIEATRAADLAASFAGDPKKVVNMLSVSDGEQVMLKVRISEMQRQIAKQFGINLSGVALLGNTPLALSTSNQFGTEPSRRLKRLVFYIPWLNQISRRSQAKPPNFSPAANSRCPRAAISKVISPSHSSNSVSVFPSRRSFCRGAASACNFPPK
jgi:pilus assembly protein CpaC